MVVHLWSVNKILLFLLLSQVLVIEGFKLVQLFIFSFHFLLIGKNIILICFCQFYKKSNVITKSIFCVLVKSSGTCLYCFVLLFYMKIVCTLLGMNPFYNKLNVSLYRDLLNALLMVDHRWAEI